MNKLNFKIKFMEIKTKCIIISLLLLSNLSYSQQKNINDLFIKIDSLEKSVKKNTQTLLSLELNKDSRNKQNSDNGKRFVVNIYTDKVSENKPIQCTDYFPLITVFISALFALIIMWRGNIMNARIRKVEKLIDNTSEIVSLLYCLDDIFDNLVYDLSKLNIDSNGNNEKEKDDLNDKYVNIINPIETKFIKLLKEIEYSYIENEAKFKCLIDKYYKYYKLIKKEKKEKYKSVDKNEIDKLKKDCEDIAKEYINKEWKKARYINIFCNRNNN